MQSSSSSSDRSTYMIIHVYIHVCICIDIAGGVVALRNIATPVIASADEALPLGDVGLWQLAAAAVVEA